MMRRTAKGELLLSMVALRWLVSESASVVGEACNNLIESI